MHQTNVAVKEKNQELLLSSYSVLTVKMQRHYTLQWLPFLTEKGNPMKTRFRLCCLVFLFFHVCLSFRKLIDVYRNKQGT